MASSKFNKLAGKSVLVLGGSSGIGYGVAEGCLESGAKVTISSSSQTKIDAAVAKLTKAYPGAHIQGFACDLSKPTAEQDLEALFERVGGPVNHVVVTAADSLSLTMLKDLDVNLMHRAIHMRMVVPFLVAKVAARRLPQSPESSIVITSGTAAYQSPPGWSLVSHLAAGLQGMVRALALEIGPIRINAVQPGFVDTGLWDGMPPEAKAALVKKLEDVMPVGRAGQVEDVAEAYLWLLKDRNVTGTIAGSDSGQFVVSGW
jgi:NAD(P)-dependent dehydrogenase (short-subunit alcohol dehydrogenase family)